MKALCLSEQTRRLAALRRALTAVVKSAPMAKRAALAEAIIATREITDEAFLRLLNDGRAVLGLICAKCRKGW